MGGPVAMSRITLGSEWIPSPSTSPLRVPLLLRRLSGGARRSLECSTSGQVEEEGVRTLKRKRPAKIDIPIMQGTGFDDGTDVRVNVVQEEGEGFSVYCKRGRRRQQMEDRHATSVDLDSRLAFFGVFDGHGGTGAAEFVSRNIGRHVMDEVTKAGSSMAEMKQAVEAGYLKTDSHLMEEEVAGGACSVTALIRNGNLIISNAGDCRAVLSRGGIAEALTSDHKPSREDERDRIERLGGYVDCYNGVWRLQGTLAVSRGFGDVLLKEYVTAEPETEVVRLGVEDEFVILASDGLWDKVSSQEAVDVARPMCAEKAKGSVLSACRRLAELSVARGSVDDVSVMIVVLGTFRQRS